MNIPLCQHCKQLPGLPRRDREAKGGPPVVLCDRCLRAIDLVNKAAIEQIAAMRFAPQIRPVEQKGAA